jgi:hypothetical protein
VAGAGKIDVVCRRQPVDPPELWRAIGFPLHGRRSGYDRIFGLVESAEAQGGILVLQQDTGSS